MSPKIDPIWRSNEEARLRYLPTLARPDTSIHFAATDTRAPKMVLSSYVKYLISIFLAERGIRDIGGVPILDVHAAVIKAAEMLVDFRKLGMPKPRKAADLDVFKEDVALARKIYGVER